MAYHHGDLRVALLAAAEALLAEGGPAAVTLRACARRAGVSHAAPQHHFRDLADLLAEVAARGFERLTVALRVARARSGEDPVSRLQAVTRTYVEFARSNPALFRLMFRTDALNEENAVLQAAAIQTFAVMTDSVAVQRGDPAVSAEDLATRIRDPGLMEDILLAWSQTHGFAQLCIEGQLQVFVADGESADQFFDRMIARTSARLSQLLQGRDGGSVRG